jgi:hypothetical protein
MKRLKQFLLALGLTLLSSLSLLAATSTWDGDTDSLWTTALNWDTAPAGGEDIVFPSVANQTVDLAAGTYNIGALTFNSPTAYSVGNGGLTLGGNVTQSGAGAVTMNASVDLGGVNRNFGGAGAGAVTLNSPVTGAGFRAIVDGGDYVTANNGNTIDRWVVNTGGKLAVQGTANMVDYPGSSYFGGDGAAGGGYLNVDGGLADYQQYYTDTIGTNSANFLGFWAGRGINFGPNGGTLLLNKDYPVDQGPTLYFSSAASGNSGTIVISQPLPLTGDGRNGTNYTGPWSVPDYGLCLGPAGNSPFGAGYARRQGVGDLTVIITNGALAYLEWSVMTNGNLTIKGQPGGNSAVAEVDANGSTTNIGRFCIRGPHRGTQYAQDFGLGLATYQRAFYLNQPYAMKFYDAVQVWERDGVENLACDISFEPGSSVDFCGGKNNRPLRLGYPQNASGLFPTNKITIKGGGNLNLNIQLRTQQWEGNGPANGEAYGVQVCAETYIQDDGQMKIYRSQNNAGAAKAIEIYRPIIGMGSTPSDARVVVQLPYAKGGTTATANSAGNADNNGVDFDGVTANMGPGCSLVVNGSTRYGLKVIGNNSWLDNLLGIGGGATSNRMESLSGSGGVLTIAATNTSGQMTLSSGPTNGNPGLIRLGFIGDLGHTYILNPGTIANFNGILVKQARVKLGNGLNMTGKNLRVGDDGAAVVALDDSATATMGQLVLAGDTSLEMGTAGGSAAVLNLANSSASAWTAGKTLTIQNWNGSASGGGPDQIKVGTDATGLTAGQLAQVKWINPYGGGDITGAKILATGEIVPPVPAFSITSAAIVNGEFVFTVPGVAGQTSVIQMATNLTPPVYWENVKTNTGAFSFTNSIAEPESYFRALVP